MLTRKKMPSVALLARGLCIFLVCAFLYGCAAAPAAPQVSAEPALTPAPTPEPTVDCGIPDFQYETEAYALQKLRERGVMAVIEYTENDDILPGLIQSQSVQAGVCVQNGQPVTLKIAKPVPTETPAPTPVSKAKRTEAPILESNPEAVPQAPTNVTYIDGIAVTPQPTWEPGKFDFEFDDAGNGYTPPCG